MQKARTHSGLIIKKASSGLGLMTTMPIRRGAFVIEYLGPIIANRDADRRLGRYLFEINSRWTIDGSPRENVARYMNHSCRPNCDIVIRGHRIFLYAKRAMKAGEELTYDYGDDYFKEFIKPKGCRCEKCSEKKHKHKGKKREK